MFSGVSSRRPSRDSRTAPCTSSVVKKPNYLIGLSTFHVMNIKYLALFIFGFIFQCGLASFAYADNKPNANAATTNTNSGGIPNYPDIVGRSPDRYARNLTGKGSTGEGGAKGQGAHLPPHSVGMPGDFFYADKGDGPMTPFESASGQVWRDFTDKRINEQQYKDKMGRLISAEKLLVKWEKIFDEKYDFTIGDLVMQGKHEVQKDNEQEMKDFRQRVADRMKEIADEPSKKDGDKVSGNFGEGMNNAFAQGKGQGENIGTETAFGGDGVTETQSEQHPSY